MTLKFNWLKKKLQLRTGVSVIGAGVLVAGVTCLITAECIGGNSTAVSNSGLNGIWKSDGYGWIWRIKDGTLTRYDATSNFCHQRGDSKNIRKYTDEAILSPDKNQLKISFDGPTYHYTFNRIPRLPSVCQNRQADTPQNNMKATDEFFQTHYAFFKERGINWPALIKRAKRRVTDDTSEAKLFEIITDLLDKTNDAHVSLEGRVDGDKRNHDAGFGPTLNAVSSLAEENNIPYHKQYKRWKKRYIRAIKDDILDGEVSEAANGQFIYGVIDDDIGYLNILSMDSFTTRSDVYNAIDKALDDIIDDFEDTEAVIIDISLNEGGYDGYARHIAERFTNKRRLAYFKYAGDANIRKKQEIYLTDRKKTKYTGPVYLMTSNVTLSAAEIFALSMRALPNVTHVGQPTRGALSDILTKRLPNNWKLSLSNEVYLDANGKLWEGRGIPPKINLTVFDEDDLFESHAEAVQQIVEMIHGS